MLGEFVLVSNHRFRRFRRLRSQFITNYLLCFLALNLKEIPYEIKPISLVKAGGEQHFNEFRDVNPMEQVPALQIDGHTLVESVRSSFYLSLVLLIKPYTDFEFCFYLAEYHALFGRNATAKTIDAAGCA